MWSAPVTFGGGMTIVYGLRFGSGTLWKYAQTVGDAEKGAVTHPGARAETHVYADL